MDAVVHAIEACIARVTTPLAQGLALQAARHLGRSLEVVCRHPDNTAARDDMAIGSHLAGMAFANSSCCAVHAIALPLGGHYPIPHGVITGCFVGEMMRHNAPACSEAFAILSSAFGWGTLAPDAFADKLDAVARSIGLYDQLRKTPVPDDALASLAEQTMSIPRLIQPNPQPLDVGSVERILRTVLSR
jgi:alcohol dehydrogenase class IV